MFHKAHRLFSTSFQVLLLKLNIFLCCYSSVLKSQSIGHKKTLHKILYRVEDQLLRRKVIFSSSRFFFLSFLFWLFSFLERLFLLPSLKSPFFSLQQVLLQPFWLIWLPLSFLIWKRSSSLHSFWKIPIFSHPISFCLSSHPRRFYPSYSRIQVLHQCEQSAHSSVYFSLPSSFPIRHLILIVFCNSTAF